jgi:excisionase family DNA binding protein
MENFLTIREVAEYLRLSTQSVRRMIEDGRLAAHKIGPCSYRIPDMAVSSMLAQTLSRTADDAPDAILDDKQKEVIP